MTIKYKVSDVAKDLNVPAKQIVDLLAQKGGDVKKTGANLTEEEVNLVFEHFTQANAEASLDAYLDSAPKPQPKASEVLKKADGTVVEMNNNKKKADKKKAEAKPEPVKREVVTKVVDTRTVDVNLDRFNEKFDELASTRSSPTTATRRARISPSAARPRPSACSASSWKRPARPS